MTAAALVPAELITATRRLQAMTMLNRARLLRPTNARDAAGGTTTTWAAVQPSGLEWVWAALGETQPADHTIIPCRVGRPTGTGQPTERLTAERAESNLAVMVTFPAGLVVHGSDRVEVDGVAHEVTAVLGPTTYETARRVLCRRGS